MNIEEILKQVIKQKGSAFFYTPPIYKNSKSYYFDKPFKSVSSKSILSIKSKIEEFGNLINNNTSGYCLINYEAGYCFEHCLNPLFITNHQIFKGFLFKKNNLVEIKSSAIIFGEIKKNFKVTSFRLNTSKAKYKASILKIKKFISEGETYQVNFTVKGGFKFEGGLINLFKSLVFNQSAKYSAFINAGDKIIISISPELFFERNGKNIITRPMKGTIERGKNRYDDLQKKENLRHSNKNLAENVMIVDLLRNDLGRICEFGTVKTKKLFEIEKYERLFQMVSEIRGRLKENNNLFNIISNIFPCGSITGAPKIRTMEIINNLEIANRGIYTGGIGIVQKDKSIFNVAIRTIEIDKSGNGKIGLGSGIVWDSDPEEEYKETLLKSRFLTSPIDEFCLFETMKYENGKIKNLNNHLDRIAKAADYFQFCIDRNVIQKKINGEIKKLDKYESKRIKIELSKWGKLDIKISDFPATKDNVKIAISKKRISSGNKFQYYKTTNRKLYNKEWKHYSEKGYFDVIFLNEKNELAEGAISNIFLRKEAKWFTPPIDSGILDGIERAIFIKTHKNVIEQRLYFKDLKSADEIVLTNSLRGITSVNSIIY